MAPSVHTDVWVRRTISARTSARRGAVDMRVQPSMSPKHLHLFATAAVVAAECSAAHLGDCVRVEESTFGRATVFELRFSCRRRALSLSIHGHVRTMHGESACALLPSSTPVAS